ncbi:hypothetical protein SS50377_23848 [Spironucleus salmonicida]|uniref:Uncharacterized protein n=1 Tax=Spironucleus salmonicida TaxID=348837 RepID=V6LTN5_9EUKA|nr:hypothetical protein SS50377_23848 [Spironucleus salmonicida]|eukprot:EST44149.1 Hypothetical protein SS50377_16051 [Spironucleus salmonicida]
MPELNLTVPLVQSLTELKKSLLQVSQKQLLPRSLVLALKKQFERNLLTDAEFVEVEQKHLDVISAVLSHSGYITQAQAEQSQRAIQCIFDKCESFELEKSQVELSMSQGISLFSNNSNFYDNQIEHLKLDLEGKNAEIVALEAEIRDFKTRKTGSRALVQQQSSSASVGEISVYPASDPLHFQGKMM